MSMDTKKILAGINKELMKMKARDLPTYIRIKRDGGAGNTLVMNPAARERRSTAQKRRWALHRDQQEVVIQENISKAKKKRPL